MKKLTVCTAFWLLLCVLLPAGALAADLLIPGGQVVGLELQENQVTVAAFDDKLGMPARKDGLREGDVLVSVGGIPIRTAGDVRTALQTAPGAVEVRVFRGGKELCLNLTPQTTPDGPRLGILLRQGISGIGTVTWYDPESGKFGTLGHGVSRGDGKLLEMTGGNLYRASVASVKKGTSGCPGQLRGTLTDREAWGRLEANSPLGLFGTSAEGWPGDPLPAAEPAQVHPGPAVIRSTVQGAEPREYAVEIQKIDPAGENRNLVLKVTDPGLLALTGGIVQGMSSIYRRSNKNSSQFSVILRSYPVFLTIKISSNFYALHMEQASMSLEPSKPLLTQEAKLHCFRLKNRKYGKKFKNNPKFRSFFPAEIRQKCSDIQERSHAALRGR